MVAIFLLAAHGAALLYSSPPTDSIVSYGFHILSALAATAACCLFSRRLSAELRPNGFLFMVGLALWAGAVFLSAWSDVVAHDSPNFARVSDFANFFYGVMILLAITLSTAERYSMVFVWIDSIQVGLAGVLAYTWVFSALPFTSQMFRPVPVDVLVRAYNVENFGLALAATLRMLSSAKGSSNRRFFGLLASGLWFYALCATVYNFLGLRGVSSSMVNLIPDLPFLLYIVLFVPLPADTREQRNPVRSGISAVFFENARSILFSLILLALGASVMKQNYRIGFIATALILLLYGLRATILQTRHARMQHDISLARDHLEALSLQDPLTHIANRRRFDQVLDEACSRAHRTQEPLSLLMIDIDHFKRLNDRLGHRSGDRCLVQVADALQKSLMRSADLAARFGGEEFAVILSDTTRDGAAIVAARICSAIRDLGMRYDPAEPATVTVSIGAATFAACAPASHGQIIEAADRALYQAKRLGRNRVEFAPEMDLSTETT